MSIGTLRSLHSDMYTSMTAAIPETMAEKMKTTGIKGEDHHGLAFTLPKMNPTYPCSRNAEGMPITVIIQPTLLSTSSERSLILDEPRVSAL